MRFSECVSFMLIDDQKVLLEIRSDESFFWHPITDADRLDIIPDRIALAEYRLIIHLISWQSP